MRTLMVAPEAFFTPQGTPLSIYHRIVELESIGHTIDLLTYSAGGPPPKMQARIYRAARLPFASDIRPGPSPTKVACDVLLTTYLIRLLRRHPYDLVYAHEEGAFVAALVTPRFDIPYVYEMHSSLPEQVTDWHFCDCAPIRHLFRWVERYTIRHARAVVATSPSLEMIARRIKPDVNVATLANAYASDECVPEERVRHLRAMLGIATTDRVVTYTGSFVSLQGLDLLIRAIPSVLAYEPNARFLLVGGRDSEIRSLERLAHALRVEHALTLECKHPHEEMPVFMAASDVLVSPRRVGVNAPGKLISYLNAGKPLVATNCAVHRQILSSDTAILTEPSPEGLARGILSALQNRVLVARITANARELAQRMRDRRGRVAAYEQLFRGLSAHS